MDLEYSRNSKCLLCGRRLYMEADRQQEMAADILNVVQQAALRVVEVVVKAVREVLTRLKRSVETAIRSVVQFAEQCMDAMLYNANDNPKWWHYYKHARKYRVRKKYRRRLERQLRCKLLDRRWTHE